MFKELQRAVEGSRDVYTQVGDGEKVEDSGVVLKSRYGAELEEIEGKQEKQ